MKPKVHKACAAASSEPFGPSHVPAAAAGGCRSQSVLDAHGRATTARSWNTGPPAQCIHVYFTDGDKGGIPFANGADITFTKLPQPGDRRAGASGGGTCSATEETAPSGAQGVQAISSWMRPSPQSPQEADHIVRGKSAVKAAGPTPEKMSSKTTFKVKISRRDAGEGRPGATVATAITPGPVSATSQGPQPAVTPAPMTTLPSSTPASAASAPGITPGAPALTPTEPLRSRRLASASC